MELEVSAEAKDKALNRRIAITVVSLSVFMAMCHIRDGNTVQAMERNQAHAIDIWNEYQANKTKQHLAENARIELQLLAAPDKAAATLATLDRDIAKYQKQSPQLAAAAKGHETEYERLRSHHDQFDAADAAISTAISLAAVAALMETAALVWVAWAFAAFGIFMAMNGFLGGSYHPELLSALLG